MPYLEIITQPQPGDTVVALCNYGCWLTEGKHYVVLKYEPACGRPLVERPASR